MSNSDDFNIEKIFGDNKVVSEDEENNISNTSSCQKCLSVFFKCFTLFIIPLSTLAIGFPILFKAKIFENLHLAAKILIPISITLSILGGEITIYVLINKSCVKIANVEKKEKTIPEEKFLDQFEEKTPEEKLLDQFEENFQNFLDRINTEQDDTPDFEDKKPIISMLFSKKDLEAFDQVFSSLDTDDLLTANKFIIYNKFMLYELYKKEFLLCRNPGDRKTAATTFIPKSYTIKELTERKKIYSFFCEKQQNGNTKLSEYLALIRSHILDTDLENDKYSDVKERFDKFYKSYTDELELENSIS